MSLRRLYYVYLFVASLVVMTAYTNCSKVDVSQVPTDLASEGVSGVPVTPNGPPPTLPPAKVPEVSEVAANCAQAESRGQLRTLNQDLVFDDTREETGRADICQWGIAGNLAFTNQNNGFLAARYEQIRKVQLPAGAVLCNFEVQTSQAKFKYDDVFYFTLNGHVMATNLQRSLSRLSSESVSIRNQSVKLYKYSWDSLRRASFEGVNDTANDFCLGQSQGLASCQWPLTEVSGAIRFDYDPLVTIAMGLRTKVAGTQEFGFAISGDNDRSLDCYHERLGFNLDIKYYVPAQ